MRTCSKKRSRLPAIGLALLCIIAILAGYLWFLLKRGISLESLSFSSISAEQVFVQADRGLVIHIGRLDVKADPDQTVPFNPGPAIAKFNTLNHLVREIRINTISHQGRTFDLLYREDEITVECDAWTAWTKGIY